MRRRREELDPTVRWLWKKKKKLRSSPNKGVAANYNCKQRKRKGRRRCDVMISGQQQ